MERTQQLAGWQPWIYPIFGEFKRKHLLVYSLIRKQQDLPASLRFFEWLKTKQKTMASYGVLLTFCPTKQPHKFYPMLIFNRNSTTVQPTMTSTNSFFPFSNNQNQSIHWSIGPQTVCSRPHRRLPFYPPHPAQPLSAADLHRAPVEELDPPGGGDPDGIPRRISWWITFPIKNRDQMPFLMGSCLPFLDTSGCSISENILVELRWS